MKCNQRTTHSSMWGLHLQVAESNVFLCVVSLCIAFWPKPETQNTLTNTKYSNESASGYFAYRMRRLSLTKTNEIHRFRPWFHLQSFLFTYSFSNANCSDRRKTSGMNAEHMTFSAKAFLGWIWLHRIPIRWFTLRFLPVVLIILVAACDFHYTMTMYKK